MNGTFYPCGCFKQSRNGETVTATLCSAHNEEYRSGGDPRKLMQYLGKPTEEGTAE